MKRTKHQLLMVIALGLFTTTIIHRRSNNPILTHTDDAPSEALRALEFWSDQRAYPKKTIPSDGFYKAHQYTQRRLKKGEKKLDPSDTWTSIGPVNRGGRTIALAVDPQNPEVVYAGSASGGLWRLTMQANPIHRR